MPSEQPADFDRAEVQVVPRAARSARRVMFAGAATCVLAAAAAVATAHQTAAHVLGFTAVGGSAAEVSWGAVGIAGVAATLWLWMASATRHGRPWTSIASTLLFALATLALRGALGPGPVATRLLAFADWGLGAAAVELLWAASASRPLRPDAASTEELGPRVATSPRLGAPTSNWPGPDRPDWGPWSRAPHSSDLF